jgi:histidinol-phosphate aminotransferase
VMIAPAAILEPIRYVMPLFNLNVIAVEALRAAMRDHTFTPWYLTQVRESKEMLYQALDRIGLRYWKSAANFVLVETGARTREIVDGLIARGVLVRDRSNDPHCAGCIRITTGVAEHTAQALRALEELCGKA